MKNNNNKITSFVLVNHHDGGDDYIFLYHGDRKPEKGDIVVCSTCYGRSYAKIVAVDVDPLPSMWCMMEYGLKPCSLAKKSELALAEYEY